MKADYRKLVVSIGGSLMAGVAGSIYTAQSVKSWYPTLSKPRFNPPAWVFGPVWTLLFIMMGVSFYLVWTKGKKKKLHSEAMAVFLVQLILNVTWSYLFFSWKNITLALAEIVVLWVMILLTIKKFMMIDKTAGYLMWPYLAWVSFATVLNLAIVWLN